MQSIIIIVKQKWNSDGVNRWVQISQTIVAYIFQCVISDKNLIVKLQLIGSIDGPRRHRICTYI